MGHAEEVLLRGQARAVEEAAEAWDKVQVALDTLGQLEDVLPMLTSMTTFYRGMLDGLWERLFAGQLRYVHETGAMLCEATWSFVKALEAHEAAIKLFEGADYEVAGAQEFREALASMKSVAIDFEARWPRFDDADLAEGLSQAERGEFADLSDVYHEFPELQKPADS